MNTPVIRLLVDQIKAEADRMESHLLEGKSYLREFEIDAWYETKTSIARKLARLTEDLHREIRISR